MNDRDDTERVQTERRAITDSTDVDTRDQRTGDERNVEARPQRSTDRSTVAADDEGFLPEQQMQTLRSEWSDIQASFVDDPQNAVQQAHQLVTQVVNDLTDVFTRERSTLEGQWAGGGSADTEALRVALQRYRSFFNRLLGTTTGG